MKKDPHFKSKIPLCFLALTLTLCTGSFVCPKETHAREKIKKESHLISSPSAQDRTPVRNAASSDGRSSGSERQTLGETSYSSLSDLSRPAFRPYNGPANVGQYFNGNSKYDEFIYAPDAEEQYGSIENARAHRRAKEMSRIWSVGILIILSLSGVYCIIKYKN